MMGRRPMLPLWPGNLAARSKAWLRRHAGLGKRGIAAVEFALIMPTFIIIFLGAIEVLTLYRAEAKVNTLVGNVAQMVAVSQQASLSTQFYNTNSAITSATISSLKDICEGAAQSLQPFPANGLTISIASVTLEPSALDANTPAATPAFDEWEADSTVSTGVSCTTAAGNVLIGAPPANSAAPINIAKANAGNASTSVAAMLKSPCDNVIIVQASLTYPGLLGLLPTRPTLTQTAYARWANASTQTQLLCSDCTLAPAVPLDFCNENNTATN